MNKIMLTAIAAIMAFAALAAAADSKNWGAYARIRHEYWKNPIDLEDTSRDDRSFFRMKFSLWGQHAFNDAVSGFAKLTNESRSYIIYEGGDAGYLFNEIVFDNLYADWKNMLGWPVDARIGRQDLLGLYAENFMFGDGTPSDGSRTFYFNAAKFAWKKSDNSAIDFLVIGNPKEDMLPVINEYKSASGVKTQLNSTEDAAFAVIGKHDPTKECHMECYYIYKTETGTRGSLSDVKLNTLGAFHRKIMDPWTLRGQLAYQTGDQGTVKRTGLGAYVFADKSFKEAKFSPVATIGYVYLSGDDITTTDNEGFNPLFSRFPSYSEYYVIELARESGPGYWTNMSIIKIQGAIVPFIKSKLTIGYNIIGAPQKAALAAGGFYGTGTNRGNLLTARLDYKFDEKGDITGYLYGEQLAPGDFYASTADAGAFSRAEIQLKY